MAKRIALWKRMAAEEGFTTPEQQQEWRQKAIKAYKESSPKTPQAKLQKAKLGYALRFTHSKPKEFKSTESTEKESLLKQYKKLQSKKDAVRELDIGYQNFIGGLNDLPPELQVELNSKLDFLIQKYGEEVVKRYLNAFGFLDEDAALMHYNPYIEILARSYLYRLTAALEIAAEGDISTDTLESASDIRSMIEQYAKRSTTKARLAEGLNESLIREQVDLSVLDEFFDDEFEDLR